MCEEISAFNRLIEQVKTICSPLEGRSIIAGLQVRKKRREIRAEYHRRLKERPGESEKIMYELAEQHFGNGEKSYQRVRSYIRMSDEHFFSN